MKKNNYKTILFDFDGVILDSLSVKDDGFKQIFSNFNNDDVEKLIDYHHLNGGISRFEKINYFFEKILGKNISSEDVQEYADNFSSIMKQYLVDPNKIITDSFKFIDKNYKKYNLHIVSGSEQNELRWLCNYLDLEKYFITINGSPTPKSELVATLIKDFNYSFDECVLIGDSLNDYEAAKKNNINFLGYNNTKLINVGYGYIESFKNYIMN
jgi:phosphoglycolate phosphatase-like HAD superfamily hydrolase